MEAKNNLRANLAVGTVILFASIFCLYCVNWFIVKTYKPHVQAILDKVLPLTILPAWAFRPEPVERMQFIVSLVSAPLMVLVFFIIANLKRNLFYEKPRLSLVVTITGIIIIAVFAVIILKTPLFFIKGETNAYYFSNNLFNKINPLITAVLYLACTYSVFIFKRIENFFSKRIFSFFSWLIVALCIIDIALYNVFHLSTQGWGTEMEGNAVFYSITQVFAGKTLLVNINSQYGLYAWILYPVFKLIGLSTFKFGMVMTLLNGFSFLLIYLGIKKIIRYGPLALITFLCLVFWQYWSTRIPLAETARAYYQYWPIRFLFPSINFYLVALFQKQNEKFRPVTLPLLAINAAFAVLWNLDSGIVVFGATLIALFFFSLEEETFKNIVKRNIIYFLWMFGSLLLIIGIFLFSVRIPSHAWPNFKQFFEFQNIFYISGFYMLPMARIHFWNLIILVYLIGMVYCIYNAKKPVQYDLPVMAFLVILGAGVFSYYQGRSYDMTLNSVMYPAIILLGVFCCKLFLNIQNQKLKYPEIIVLFLLTFFFLIDGAASMLYYTPSVHAFAWDNSFRINKQFGNQIREKENFIKSNIPRKDTVLILAQNYESYYYACGQYYNPVNLPGSTEIFFKWQVDTLLQFIAKTAYPIVYDANLPWINSDTIIKTISKYACIEKELDGQGLVLLRPYKALKPDKIIGDSAAIHYHCHGDFIKYLSYPVPHYDKY